MTRQHGRNTTYTRGCRCDECRRAASDYQHGQRHLRYAARTFVGGRWIAPVPEVRHGSVDVYRNHGCRCVSCTRANREHLAAYRARRRAS